MPVVGMLSSLAELSACSGTGKSLRCCTIAIVSLQSRSSVQQSTNKLPGNVQFGCATYHEAVAAFNRAEANGEVEQRM